MYNYETEKPWLFTDEGQRALLKVRDAAFELIEQAGAARFDKIFQRIVGGVGDSWREIALLDRLVEIGDLRLLSLPAATQYRIYVRQGK